MEELIIQGKPHPIHFGLKTLNRFAKSQREEFSDVLTAKNALASFDSIVDLTCLALNDGAQRSGSDNRFSEDDVWDIFEQEPDLILVVSEKFVESITPLAERIGNLPKNLKRPTKKRSK